MSPAIRAARSSCCLQLLILLGLWLSQAASPNARALENLAQHAFVKSADHRIKDSFGWAVAVCGDTAVIGAYGRDDETGAAYVFVRRGTDWVQQAVLHAPHPDPEDQFGWAVDISGDTIVVGAYGESSAAVGIDGDGTDNRLDSSGAAYVFVRNGTSWTRQAYLKPSNTDAEDRFGFSVGISGDTIIVGAYLEDGSGTGAGAADTDNGANRAGAAYVFEREGDRWHQEAYLKASNTSPSSHFGWSVAISGDTVAIGAYSENSGVGGDRQNPIPSSGAAYVFERDGTVWRQQAFFKAPDPGEDDRLGISVAVSGNTVVVGAPLEDGSATGVGGDDTDNGTQNSGAAYVLTRTGDTWSLQAYLKASNSGEGDLFGRSVAIEETLSSSEPCTKTAGPLGSAETRRTTAISIQGRHTSSSATGSVGSSRRMSNLPTRRPSPSFAAPRSPGRRF